MIRNKQTIKLGAGASIGVIQTVLMREYIDPTFGPIPVIGDYLGVWGRWSSFGNILIGGVALVVSQFTQLIKNDDINDVLSIYGMTTLVGGIMNGVFPRAGLGMRATAGPRVTLAARANRMAPITATGIPPAKVLA